MLIAQSDPRMHLPTILVGLHWLYDTPQPDGTSVALENGGQALTSADGWRFTFKPTAGPGGAPVIVLDAQPRESLTQNDVDQLAVDIDDFGVTVRRIRLSGGRAVFELTGRAHPSLIEAVARAQLRPAACSRAVELSDLQQQMRWPAPALTWPASASGPSTVTPPRTARAGHRWRSTAVPAGLRLRCRRP